jgi:hypothetical protein
MECFMHSKLRKSKGGHMTRRGNHRHGIGSTTRIMIILGAGMIGLMHPEATQATPLDFTFSFSNVIGNTAGTVTGEIFGLTEGATSSATNVIVDTYPPGLEPHSPPQTIFTNVLDNAFTVDSIGDITDATFLAVNSTATLGLGLNTAPLNFLQDLNGHVVRNDGGFSGATYTLVQPTPEPSSVTILGTGLGLAALWQLRQRRRRRWAAA